MSNFREFYRAQAEKLFNPALINNPDDEEAMVEKCLNIMRENKVPLSEDEDEWLEFVYRAIEICELHENGYYYHRVRNPNKRDGWDYVVETLPEFLAKKEAINDTKRV